MCKLCDPDLGSSGSGDRPWYCLATTATSDVGHAASRSEIDAVSFRATTVCRVPAWAETSTGDKLVEANRTNVTCRSCRRALFREGGW